MGTVIASRAIMKRKPNSNERIIYGLFDTREEVEVAFERLLGAGISIDDISMLMNEDVHDRDFKALDRTRTKEGAAVGSVLGGTLGGVLGGLVSLGTAISGFGLVIVGPLVALAAAGGLVGGLIGHGIQEEEAQRLHDAIQHGKALIAVRVHDALQGERSQEIVSRSHGEPIELAG